MSANANILLARRAELVPRLDKHMLHHATELRAAPMTDVQVFPNLDQVREQAVKESVTLNQKMLTHKLTQWRGAGVQTEIGLLRDREGPIKITKRRGTRTPNTRHLVMTRREIIAGKKDLTRRASSPFKVLVETRQRRASSSNPTRARMPDEENDLSFPPR